MGNFQIIVDGIFENGINDGIRNLIDAISSKFGKSRMLQNNPGARAAMLRKFMGNYYEPALKITSLKINNLFDRILTNWIRKA